MREQEREIEKKRQEIFSKSGRVWWEMGAATNQVELSQSLISSETGFEVKIRISWPCCAHNGKTKIREKQKIKSVGNRKIKSVGTAIGAASITHLLETSSWLWFSPHHEQKRKIGKKKRGKDRL